VFPRCGSSCSSVHPSGGPSVTLWMSSLWSKDLQESGSLYSPPAINHILLYHFYINYVFSQSVVASGTLNGEDGLIVMAGTESIEQNQKNGLKHIKHLVSMGLILFHSL
jgi:hypothetical protein